MKFVKKNGFTLVEIMIVVAIIGILASLAIPSLMRVRLTSNENSLKSDLKAFITANESYRSVQNPTAYAEGIDALINPGSGPGYLDSSWESGERRGYTLTYAAAAAPAATYSLLAEPTTPGSTGNNTFCIDQNGVILSSTSDGAANVPTGSDEGCSGGLPGTG